MLETKNKDQVSIFASNFIRKCLWNIFKKKMNSNACFILFGLY